MKLGEFEFETSEYVYNPSDDTFLLIDNLTINKDDKVLEIGTGSGLIAMHASKIVKTVIATDISYDALCLADKNFKANNIQNITLKFGNLFEPVKNEKFDVILFNTPYLPTSSDEVLEDNLNYAFDGGVDGRKIIDPFLNQVKNHLNHGGKVQLVQSSLSGNEKTILKLNELGFKSEITAHERFFFEEIVVITGVLEK
ncbi:HemK2/MTQ2 family protein methyltransferase [Methanobrevibacter filiformis]|uniref:Ribosomal protein L11 methyltransferase n=1 Tax=Methanobrevibacter filiformis TaxID=55758 RepID=A0A166F9U3_9EURY|nr:HemK2/MTQ2 family protein methyltransferase [Methanobrevibacter filiformis]KZX17450.1 ribosomal protein L11 methyltransferase [Methanobrevibacter filiformis]